MKSVCFTTTDSYRLRLGIWRWRSDPIFVDGYLQVTDFGLAVINAGPGQKLKDDCGSLPFVAPEALRQGLEEEEGGGAQREGYDGPAVFKIVCYLIC